LALDGVDVPYSPAWWMKQLAARMLDRNRLLRFGILDSYRAGRPPLLSVSPTSRATMWDFLRVSRSNFARVIVRAPAERMGVRSIRTAAASDDNGDDVAWRYWTGSGLDVTSTDVHSDELTFSDTYVRVAVGPDEQPIALRCDPWSTITIPDPLNPNVDRAAFHLLWDEFAGVDYAYLWLPGEQYVASAKRESAPSRFIVPGTQTTGRWRWPAIPRMSFSPSAFTMRPDIDDVPETSRDGGPYCEHFDAKVVPVVRFPNRDGVGEFEEHLDLLDRINHGIMVRVVAAAVQAYKQRALRQDGTDGKDRLPDKNPDTGETINWDEIFQPGPDALWKLPPGVSIWESSEVQLIPMNSSIQEDVKHLSAVTSTPFSLFSPDGVNQSAEGAQLTREGLVFKVEDRDKIAARSWARVMSLMFQFGPESDRFDGDGNDRADAGKIVIDWAPSERFSLAERAQADSQNKSLSQDMAAAKLWGLSPDEVSINRAQRAAAALIAPPPAATPAPIPAPAPTQPANDQPTTS